MKKILREKLERDIIPPLVKQGIPNKAIQEHLEWLYFNLISEAFSDDEYKAYSETLNSDEFDPKKGPIKMYNTLAQALLSGNYGDIISTLKSKKIYVIRPNSWGNKSSSKVVTGFSMGVPMAQIVSYSNNIRSRYLDKPTEDPEYRRQQLKNIQSKIKDLEEGENGKRIPE